MVLSWGRVKSARIRSGQVGKSTCQGTHVIFEITEITPPIHYTYPRMRHEKRSTVIYIDGPKLVFVFRVQAVYDHAHFTLPLMDSSFRFPRMFPILFVYKIQYNFVLTIVWTNLISYGVERTKMYGSLFFADHRRTFHDKRRQEIKLQLISIFSTSREN